MRYSFDDLSFGKTLDGTVLNVRLVDRPPGLTREAWYHFASQLVVALNRSVF